MHFKIDWASLIIGSKFTIFALFYFVFEGNFPSTSPQGAYIWRGDLTEGFLRYEFGGGGAYIWRGDLTEGFLRYRFGGLIFGGAYTWRGLFSEFYGKNFFHNCSSDFLLSVVCKWRLYHTPNSLFFLKLPSIQSRSPYCRFTKT